MPLRQQPQGHYSHPKQSTDNNPIKQPKMKTRLLSSILHMRIFAHESFVLILLASLFLIVMPSAGAKGYRCFDRQTGEQVAVSDIDITTPSVSCLPNDGTTAAPNGNNDDVSPEKFPEDDYEDNSPTPSTPSQSTTTVDLLASRRAINLARGTAISLNGGLSQYRPGNCMFASAKDNPCITRSDLEGIEFTIPGGPPGWEQKGNKPSVTTVVVVATDGRSVLESRNN